MTSCGIVTHVGVARRSFDNDNVTLTVFVNPTNDAPYALIRTYNAGNRWYSMKGVHELCVRRDGSALQLKRWSHKDHQAKLWAVLYFLTWEGNTQHLGPALPHDADDN